MKRKNRETPRQVVYVLRKNGKWIEIGGTITREDNVVRARFDKPVNIKVEDTIIWEFRDD